MRVYMGAKARDYLLAWRAVFFDTITPTVL